MDKYSRYYGIVVFVILVFLSAYLGITKLVVPAINTSNELDEKITSQTALLDKKKQEKANIVAKKQQLKNTISEVSKKVYSPIDSDLGNDTLFFTLYNDVIEMIHSNSVKIKSLEYSYNPENDVFVKFDKDIYFVCDVDMELISNYVNLGKMLEDICQYPYYIKINGIDVKPYPKDKTILIANMSLRLYAHTRPDENAEIEG